jgi:hypothetical protein
MNIYPDFPYWTLYNVANHPGAGYQASITIPWKSGMKMNFDDIRFHDQNEKKINYYIESYTSGVSANVLIKLTSSKKLYLRWGNGSAKSESDPTKVYDLFCDFNSANETNALFDIIKSPTLTYSNSELAIICSAEYTYLQSKSSFLPGSILEFSEKGDASYHYDLDIGFGCRVYPTISNAVSREIYTNDQICLNTQNTIGEISSSGVAKSNNYRVFKILWTINSAKMFIDNNQVANNITYIPTVPLKVTIGRHYWWQVANKGTIQWMKIRKYAAIEPTLIYVSSGYVNNIHPIIPETDTEPEQELIVVEYPFNNDMSCCPVPMNINDENLEFILDTFSFIDNPVLCRQVNDIWYEQFTNNTNNIIVDFPPYININDLNLAVYPLNSDDTYYYWDLFTDRSSISKYDVFFSNNDMWYKNLEYTDSSDVYLSWMIGYLTDVNLYGKYVNMNYIWYKDLLYENFNDLNLSILLRDPVNILLNKARLTHNNIRSNFYLNISDDILLKSYFSILNNIFSNLADNVVGANDIEISTVFDRIYSNLYGGCKFKSYNDIYIIGGNSTYINISDIEVFSNLYVNNDIINYPRLTAPSNILVMLKDSVATSKVRVAQYLHDTSDLNYLYQGSYGNINDLYFSTGIYNVNDFGVDGLRNMKVVYNLGDIYKNYGLPFRSEINVIDTYRTYSNLYGGAKFKFRHDMYYHFDRVNNNKIRISEIYRTNSDLLPMLRYVNRNQIIGRIKSNRKEYLNNKLPAPFVEEKEFERSGVFPVYPNSNLLFVFSNEEAKIFNPVINQDIENIQDCKGVGWFNDNGVEFIVFNKAIMVHEVNVYLNFYNRVTLHLEDNTHIYHGYISYANKTTDLDSEYTYTTIKDILLLVNRIGLID